MKRHILHIAVFMIAALFAESVWGQTNIPEGWSKLPNPTKKEYQLPPGKYILVEDMLVNSGCRWEIGDYEATTHRSGNYTINLNGHTIDAKNSTGSLFNMSTGTLTIIDEPVDGSIPDGKIMNTKNTCVYVGPTDNKDYVVTFNMKGGTIENCRPGNGEGGAVEVEQNTTRETAIFNMYEGATITNVRLPKVLVYL